MSLKSNDYHRGGSYPATPGRFRYIQRAILNWGLRVTERGDLFCTVLPEGSKIDAPAQYLPAVGQVQVPSEAFADVEVERFGRGQQSLREFTREHPSLMGKFIHEYGHAGWSPRARYLEQFRLGNSNSTYQVLMLLMEGHCEVGIYRVIDDLEKAALRTTVLTEVLGSLAPEGEETSLDDPRTAINLMGLIAARAQEGIIVTEPDSRGAKIVAMAKQALGEFAPRFYALAVRFATLPTKDEYGYDLSYRNGDAMQSVCLEWEELTAEFLQQGADEGDEGDEPGGQPGDDEGDEPGESGDEGDEGDEPGGQPGDDEGDEPGESGDEGDEGDESDEPGGQPGDQGDESDDQGDESGDEQGKSRPEQPGDEQGRERVALTDEENTGAEGFGTYAGGTSQFDADALAEALDAIEEGASIPEAHHKEEIEIVYREFLHAANEQWRQEHRQSVRDAEAIWDKRRRIWR